MSTAPNDKENRALPLDIAARIGHRARFEQADLQRLALEQYPADDLHGQIPLLIG
jgi:hypothetical protein